MNVLAIDIGGTKIACGTYNANGKKLSHHIATLEKHSGTEVGTLITALIQKEFSEMQKLRTGSLGRWCLCPRHLLSGCRNGLGAEYCGLVGLSSPG